MSKHRSNQPAPQSTPIPKSVSVSTTVVSGPLPSPEILIRYNDAVPSAAERILAMAEHDSAHLQSIEKMRLSAFYHERRMGQFLGFGIAIMGIGASVFLALYNHELTASVLGGTTLVGLVSVFVVGRLARNTKSSN